MVMVMTIYVDIVFILNFSYDFLLLLTVNITLKRYSKIYKLILATLFGNVTIISLFIPINSIFLIILKVILGIIMVIIAFGYKNFLYTFYNIIYLYMTSVILAGFLYFLKLEFNNLSYILILLIAPFILYLYIKEQNNLKRVVNYYTKVLINFKNNRHLELKAFIDSGNKLQDPITHKYIILINKKRLKGIYNIRSPMYVPIKTVNKTSLLECIPIKNIEVNGKVYENYLLGLSDTFKMQDDIECLLNYHLIEE